MYIDYTKPPPTGLVIIDCTPEAMPVVISSFVAGDYAPAQPSMGGQVGTYNMVPNTYGGNNTIVRPPYTGGGPSGGSPGGAGLGPGGGTQPPSIATCTTDCGPVVIVPPPPTVTGVPEPETWTLMLIGIGLIGPILRRTKQYAY